MSAQVGLFKKLGKWGKRVALLSADISAKAAQLAFGRLTSTQQAGALEKVQQQLEELVTVAPVDGLDVVNVQERFINGKDAAAGMMNNLAFGWFEMHAAFCWQPDEMPTLKEVRTHAKCLRSTEQVRNYFRKYRAARRATSTSMRTSASESDSDDAAAGDCAPTIQSGLVGCAGLPSSASKPSCSVGTGDAMAFIPFTFGAAGPSAGLFFNSAGSAAFSSLGVPVAHGGLLQGCGPAAGAPAASELPAFAAYSAQNPLQPTTSGAVSGYASRMVGKRTPHAKYAARTSATSSLGLPPRQPVAAARPAHLPPAAAAVSGPVISFSNAGQPQHSAHGSGAACSIGGGIVLQLPQLQRTGSASARLQGTPTKHSSPAPTAPPAKRTSLRSGYDGPNGRGSLQLDHGYHGPAPHLGPGGPDGSYAQLGTAGMQQLMAGNTMPFCDGQLSHHQLHHARASSVPPPEPLMPADVAALCPGRLPRRGDSALAPDGIMMPGDNVEGDGAAMSPILASFRMWQQQEMDDLLDDLSPMSPGLLAVAARMDASDSGRSAQLKLEHVTEAACLGGMRGLGQALPVDLPPAAATSAWAGPHNAQWAPAQQHSAVPCPYPGGAATNPPYSLWTPGAVPSGSCPRSLVAAAGCSGAVQGADQLRARARVVACAASPGDASGVQAYEQRPHTAAAAGMLPRCEGYGVDQHGTYPPPYAQPHLGPGHSYAFHQHRMPLTEVDGSSMPMSAPSGMPYAAYPFAAHLSTYAPYGYGPLPPGYPPHPHQSYYYPQLPAGGDMYGWPAYPHAQHQAMPQHMPYSGMMYGGGGYAGYPTYPQHVMGNGATDGAMVNTGPPEASSMHVRAAAASARTSGGCGGQRPSALPAAACAPAEPLMPGRYVWQATTAAGKAHKGLAAGGSGDHISRLGAGGAPGRTCDSQSVSVAQAVAVGEVEAEDCIESGAGGSRAAVSAAANPAKMLPPPPRQAQAHGSSVGLTAVVAAATDNAVLKQAQPANQADQAAEANHAKAVSGSYHDADRQQPFKDGQGLNSGLLDLSVITAGLFSPAASNVPVSSGGSRGYGGAGGGQAMGATGIVATPSAVAAAAAVAASAFAFTPVQTCAGTRLNPFAHMVPTVRHPGSSCAAGRTQEQPLAATTTAGGGNSRLEGQTPCAERCEVLHRQQFASGLAATPGSAAAFGMGGSPFDSTVLASWLTSPTSMATFDACGRQGLDLGDAGGITGGGKSWDVGHELLQMSQPADATSAGAEVHCASDLTAHIQITYMPKASAEGGGGKAAKASEGVCGVVQAARQQLPFGKGMPLVGEPPFPSALAL
ncbi:hypothetical protein TSOC_013468 [Tetrabaena socialis]|uniref:Uncharacterized protein n=1 Tax=Tetrabaena socialis TaxID=47790 RepID=A0A2J7ZK96_9CHLO|nr:hypothetical protein TSOC_013468 [Tetrabaena socialis]|eukprot:PNH00696.1 hypothetical protein TSOC_013468 [Tetrabaena socialis]